MIDSDNFDFSFSGLKTAVLYKVKEFFSHCHPGPRIKYGAGFDPESINKIDSRFRGNDMRGGNDIAAEFQQAVVDVLVSKTIKAAKKYQAKSIMLGGGVAANKLLRREMARRAHRELSNTYYLQPTTSLCTDNAAMIGVCAYFRYLNDKNNLQNWQKIKINLNPEL